MRLISYNKLWKFSIDKNMNKKDLRLCSNLIAKLGKGAIVTTDVLLIICEALNRDN